MDDARDVPPRFAVAFSLAGEQRDLVLPIAQEVEAVLGRSSVFYDRWYEHWTAGDDADVLLQDLYAKKCELVVVCVSGNYGDKAWPRTEHKAIRERMMGSDQHDLAVLPVRVGEGDVEGIRATAIVPDVRPSARSAAAAAGLIVARLNLVRAAAGGDRPAWPDVAPELSWRICDQVEVRDAFAALLVGDSPARALLVEGPSGSGKTHLSTQMARSAAAQSGVRCGRLDLKGTTHIDIACAALARPLALDPPPGGSLAERLGRILAELRRRQEPTVLVVDSYETAGELTQWAEQVLLPELVAADWLRVVVVGQTVPRRSGAMWADICAPPLVLRPPEPEDWQRYGQVHLGEQVSLELLREVHRRVDGAPWFLAALFPARA